jgi:DNA-binding MarR family transcriptional regulator
MTQDPEELPGLTASSGYLLARIGAESRRRWARMLAEQDLTPHHFGILTALDTGGPTYQQRLAEVIGVDRRNAVAVAGALERRGLLRREPDAENQRRYVVTLTSAGRSALDAVRGTGETLEAELLAPLTAREQATLHRLLEKLFAGTTRGPSLGA